MKQCKKHPDNASSYQFSDGRFRFCTDCMAEALIKFGIEDLATAQEKEQAEKYSMYGHVDARINLTPHIATFLKREIEASDLVVNTKDWEEAKGAEAIVDILAKAIEQSTGKPLADILKEVK